MAANHYHCITRWRLRGAIDDVYEVLLDAKSLPVWWPAAHRDVLEIQSGGPEKVDKVVRLESKGFLPYRVNWHFTVTETERPRGFGIKFWGDIDGSGRWTLRQDGEFVDVQAEWRIMALKPVLRYGSFILRPLLAMDFGWVMRKGEESLALELVRLRAATEAERRSVAAPPSPAVVPYGLMAVAAGVLLVAGLVRRRPSRSQGG